MPGKMAISGPRPPFGLREVTVAVRTSRLYCRKARKTPNIHANLGVIRGIPAQ
jgi:hypothetical protein